MGKVQRARGLKSCEQEKREAPDRAHRTFQGNRYTWGQRTQESSFPREVFRLIPVNLLFYSRLQKNPLFFLGIG